MEQMDSCLINQKYKNMCNSPKLHSNKTVRDDFLLMREKLLRHNLGDGAGSPLPVPAAAFTASLLKSRPWHFLS